MAAEAAETGPPLVPELPPDEAQAPRARVSAVAVAANETSRVGCIGSLLVALPDSRLARVAEGKNVRRECTERASARKAVEIRPVGSLVFGSWPGSSVGRAAD